MKTSEAMEKGIARYPKSTVGSMQRGEDKACIDGCARFGFTGNPWAVDSEMPEEYLKAEKAFEQAYGNNWMYLNDVEIKTREEIIQMLKDIGY